MATTELTYKRSAISPFFFWVAGLVIMIAIGILVWPTC
jgi:hypothetical protein